MRLWSVDLADPDRPDEARLRAPLDAEERARLDRLRPPRAADRFAAAHAALRAVLGEALGRAPGAVRLARDPQGKPRLGEAGPAFNMAHSGDVAAIAVGGRTGLGVDVEVLRPMPRLGALIRYACTPAEREALEAVADAELRAERFLEFWVRKEAVLKAAGRGLREHPGRLEAGREDWVTLPGTAGLRAHVRSTRCLGQPAAVAITGAPCAFEPMRFDWAALR